MADIIAERVLHFEGNLERRVFVRIMKPRATGDSECGCTYRLELPDRTREHTAFGIDTLQALKCAYVMISGEIAYIEQLEGARLVCSDGSPADI